MMPSAMRTLSYLLPVLLLGAGACKSSAPQPNGAQDGPAAAETTGAPEADRDPAPVPVSALAKELVEHLLDEDASAAMKLLISRKDFARPEIWDALAANELAKKMPADISYSNTRGDSLEVVEAAIQAFRGAELEYLRTEMPEPEVKNDRFDLYRGPMIVVRNADEQEQKLRLIGSLLHDKEQELWYVVHFDDDPPKAPRNPRPAPAPDPG